MTQGYPAGMEWEGSSSDDSFLSLTEIFELEEDTNEDFYYCEQFSELRTDFPIIHQITKTGKNIPKLKKTFEEQHRKFEKNVHSVMAHGYPAGMEWEESSSDDSFLSLAEIFELEEDNYEDFYYREQFSELRTDFPIIHPITETGKKIAKLKKIFEEQHRKFEKKQKESGDFNQFWVQSFKEHKNKKKSEKKQVIDNKKKS